MKIELSNVDFVVINLRTGNAVAAFMLPNDAVSYVRSRGSDNYEIRNADGSPVSWVMQDHACAKPR